MEKEKTENNTKQNTNLQSCSTDQDMLKCFLELGGGHLPEMQSSPSISATTKDKVNMYIAKVLKKWVEKFRGILQRSSVLKPELAAAVSAEC